MSPGLQSLAEAASWLGDLVPFLTAPLILLLVWEIVVLLAAVLGIRSDSHPDRSRSRRARPGHRVGIVLLCAAAASSGCDIAPTEPETGSSGPPTPAFSSAPGGGYTAIDLGTLGGSWSYAWGVNQLGQIVGESRDAAEWGQAFVWTDGEMVAINPLPRPTGCVVGGGNGWAYDINNSGQIVGGSGIGFLWQDGSSIPLAPLSGCGVAYAINEAGWVVGTDRMGPTAFLWRNGEYTDLGQWAAYDVNDVGQVAGASMYPHSAFLWDDGVVTYTGTLGGMSSAAFGINDAGDLVGSSFTTGKVIHAFLWRDGVMTDLGTLGGTWSEATAINNAGQVVGTSQTEGNATAHAFLWQDGVMTDLGTLGGTWSEAYDINDAGWIVGVSGTTDNAATHATLWRILTPVEAIERLIADVQSLASGEHLPGQNSTGLLAKLRLATALLNDGKSRAAIQQLEAFILQVEGLSAAGRLDPDLGQPLIDAARVLIGRLD